MALPKLTVTLFPPKPGKAYAASGSLVIPLSDLHALAEWLLGQAGEYDDYKQQHVVRLLAFEYHNSSRSGTNSRPPAAGSMPQQAHLQATNPADDHGDLPF